MLRPVPLINRMAGSHTTTTQNQIFCILSYDSALLQGTPISPSAIHVVTSQLGSISGCSGSRSTFFQPSSEVVWGQLQHSLVTAALPFANPAGHAAHA